MKENLDKEFADYIAKQNLTSLFEQKTAGVWRCEKYSLDIYPSKDWARNYRTGAVFDTVEKAVNFIKRQTGLPTVPVRTKSKYSIGDVLFYCHTKLGAGIYTYWVRVNGITAYTGEPLRYMASRIANPMLEEELFQTWGDVSRAIEKARKRTRANSDLSNTSIEEFFDYLKETAKDRFENKKLIIGENYESDPNPISHS